MIWPLLRPFVFVQQIVPPGNEESVQIIVNGEERSIVDGSVLSFLESIGIDPRRVAVELNLDIVAKDEYYATLLKEGDRLEIVHFVGGG